MREGSSHFPYRQPRLDSRRLPRETFRYMKHISPFILLDLKMKPRSLFEEYTMEGSQITSEERELAFARMVWAGYHLKEEALRYLAEKGASRDEPRWFEVRGTLASINEDLIQRITERVRINKEDPDIAELLDFTRSNYKPKVLRSFSLEEHADLLEEIFRRSFSMRELVREYIKDRPPYHPLLDPSIDLSDSVRCLKRIETMEQWDETLEINTAFVWWTYRGLYASWFLMHWEKLQDQKAFPLPNYVAEHTNPEMWSLPPCHPIELALAKKYFPIEEQEYLKANDDLQRERLLSLATRQAEILWLQAPAFDDPVYVWRTSYEGKPAQHTSHLYEEGVVSICIQDYAQTGCDKGHQEYFDALAAGEKSPRPKGAAYIQDFMKLASKAKEQDLLVVARYKGESAVRIGLIKQGTEYYMEQHAGYRLYCFKLKSAYCTPCWGTLWDDLDPKDYPLLQSTIKTMRTITQVVNQRKKEAVYRAYYGVIYPQHYSLLSDEATEELCKMWLTSDLADAYGLSVTHIDPKGSTPHVDISGRSWGMTTLAQVTPSSDPDKIKKKENRLPSIDDPYTQYVVFADYMPDIHRRPWGKDRYRIGLEEVWNGLYDIPKYREQIAELCSLRYQPEK